MHKWLSNVCCLRALTLFPWMPWNVSHNLRRWPSSRIKTQSQNVYTVCMFSSYLCVLPCASVCVCPGKIPCPCIPTYTHTHTHTPAFVHSFVLFQNQHPFKLCSAIIVLCKAGLACIERASQTTSQSETLWAPCSVQEWPLPPVIGGLGVPPLSPMEKKSISWTHAKREGESRAPSIICREFILFWNSNNLFFFCNVVRGQSNLEVPIFSKQWWQIIINNRNNNNNNYNNNIIHPRNTTPYSQKTLQNIVDFSRWTVS